MNELMATVLAFKKLTVWQERPKRQQETPVWCDVCSNGGGRGVSGSVEGPDEAPGAGKVFPEGGLSKLGTAAQYYKTT